MAILLLLPIFAIGYGHNNDVCRDGNKFAVDPLRCLKVQWQAVESNGKKRSATVPGHELGRGGCSCAHILCVERTGIPPSRS